MKKYSLLIILFFCFLQLQSQEKPINAKSTVVEKIKVPINVAENNAENNAKTNYSPEETERLYQLTNDRLNNYLTYTAIVSAIFGLIIGLASIYLGFAGLRAQKRNESAIKTLEEAKNYVSGKKTEFDNLITQKGIEIESEYQKILNFLKDKLLSDIDLETSKVKEVAERKSKELENISAQESSSKTIEVLEKRLEFFENIGIPDDPQILLSKAKILREKGMNPEAITLLEKILATEPNNIDAHWHLGYEYSLIGNSEKSIFHYEKVLDINPKYASALNNLGVELVRSEKYYDAIDNYNIAIEIEPTNALYYRNKISALISLNSSEKVLQTYDKLIEIEPKNILNYENAVKYLNSINRKEAVIMYLDKAIENCEESEKTQVLKLAKALQLKSLKQWSEAIELFQKLIDENISVEKCYLNIADIKNEQGQTTEAIEILDKAIYSSPLNASLYMHKAFFESKKDPDKSWETIIVGSSQIQGESYFFSCGRFFNEKGNLEFGKKSYQNALNLIQLKLDNIQEGDILNYYESLIIVDSDQSSIDEFIEKFETYITTEKYQVLFQFLTTCNNLKTNSDKESLKNYMNIFKNLNIESKDYKVDWNFGDISLAMKSKVNQENLIFIDTLSKYISKQIEFQDLEKTI